MPEYLDGAPLLTQRGRCGSRARTFCNKATRQPRHLVARLPAPWRGFHFKRPEAGLAW